MSVQRCNVASGTDKKKGGISRPSNTHAGEDLPAKAHCIGMVRVLIAPFGGLVACTYNLLAGHPASGTGLSAVLEPIFMAGFFTLH